MFLTEISLIVAAYLLGCFTTGYYLVRLRSQVDIRDLGSRCSGTRNVGRVLGPSGMAITFMGDAGKGAIAAMTTSLFYVGDWAVILVILAVVAGHVWPVQLGFNGGKGMATAWGAIAAVDWRIGLSLVAISAILVLFLKRTTVSGLIAAAIAPVVCLVLKSPNAVVAGVSALSLLMIFTHRNNIRQILQEIAQHRRDKSADIPTD